MDFSILKIVNPSLKYTGDQFEQFELAHNCPVYPYSLYKASKTISLLLAITLFCVCNKLLGVK